MELSNRKFLDQNLLGFSPHYSELEQIPASHIDFLDKLNLAKTIICLYIIVFALLLRMSHILLMPFVALIGSPIFIFQYFKFAADEKKQKKAHASNLKHEDSA